MALVELFAWMTEGLLYRTNQIPERTYVRFLEMLGTHVGTALVATRGSISPA